MSKYYKNFILCGDIDFFCILCKESFDLESEVERHIRWEQHRRLIKGQAYFSKLKKECLYKIENRYYCEVCNCVSPSWDTAKNHVKEENHKQNLAKKDNCEPTDKEVVAERILGSVKISNIYFGKREWHCIVNSQCLFCNVSVPNFDSHITTPDHMIKLIQSKVKIEKDDHIYRKFNDGNDTVYCFKCRITMPEQDLSAHWTDKHNDKEIQQSGDKKKKLFEVDKESNLVTCLLCNKTLDWSWMQIHRHRFDHMEKKEWIYEDNEEEAFRLFDHQDKGKLRAELKKYGKENYIKLNEGGGKGYCSLCNTFISAHMRNFKQHVGGINHTGHLELRGLIKKTKKAEKPRYKTKPLNEVMKDLLRIKSYFYHMTAKLSIHMLSFTMMTLADANSERVICFLCGGIYDNATVHLKGGNHTDKLMKTDVLTSLKDEFVREISPGLYHCGICNVTVAGWKVLERHFNFFKHRFAKVDSREQIEEVMEDMMERFEGTGTPADADVGKSGEDILD